MPDRDYRNSGFFVLRVPLQPVDAFVGWGGDLRSPEAQDLEAAVAQDRTRLREGLRRWVAKPAVREAIYLASPDLEASIDPWLEDPDTPRGRRAERALVRYMTRMATRPTPFGLFAASITGVVADETALGIPGPRGVRRHSRLDMHYLDGLARALAQDEQALEALPLIVNATLHRSGPHLRYVEARSDGRRRSHHLVSVRATPVIDAVIEVARSQPSLAAVVQAAADHGARDPRSLIDDLVRAQVLRVDLEPPLTGPPALDGLLGQLEHWPATEGTRSALRSAREELAALDADGPGAPPDRYRKIAAMLEPLPAPVDPALLFQVDVTADAGVTLGREVVEEIARAVEVMRALSPGGEPAPLIRFRQRFSERFQNREVPLLEALDEETGVAFEEALDPSPLLDPLGWQAPEAGAARWGPMELMLLRRVEAAIRGGDPEIVLTRDDLDSVGRRPAPIPTAFAVTASLIGAGGGLRVLVRGVHGPPGVRLFGRFCHADPRLRSLVMEHLEAEEALDPEAVHAEVVHLPHGREGNVLARPVLRPFEVPYLGRSGAPPERQIPVADLRISVVKGRLVLRSASLGRRVVPRMSTAHNYVRPGLGVYRLLCMLAVQGASDHLVWTPGPVGEGSYVPRVRVGRVIVSPARWRIWPDEVRSLRPLEGAALLEALRTLRARRGLPRMVALTDGDNALVGDLENVLSAEAWVGVLPAEGAYIEETFLEPEHLPVHGPDGRYAHEVVVPFVRTTLDAPHPQVQPSPAPVVRTVPPGRDWLYLKIYTGTATADRVLVDAVAPAARAAVDRGEADRWFFVRYSDPHWHLRVRIHGDPRSLDESLDASLRPFLEEGSVWRIEHGTYEREVERYGGPQGLEAAEAIFHADSEAVAELLSLVEPGDAGADERWRLGLAATHRLLEDLGFHPDEELVLVRGLAESFEQELAPGLEVRRGLGRRFRAEREDLVSLVEPGAGHPLALGFEVLTRRSASMQPVAGQLRAAGDAGDLTLPLEEVAGSLVHMHLNRILRSRHRAQEMAILSLLGRIIQNRRHGR